jgi:DNA-binding response OmpR family regulator
MDCPHCGGRVDRAAQLLLDAAFDDDRRCLVVDDARRHLLPMQWRLLTLLRERFRRLVPLDFLTQAAAPNSADGGSVNSTRVQICFLRRALAGSPFAIASVYGDGYGLFRADDVAAQPRRNSHGTQYRLRRDIAAGPLAGLAPPGDDA